MKRALRKSCKTTDGLTRGTQMSDVQRPICLFSKLISLEYSAKMEDFTNSLYTTSEQHKIIATSRLKRDKQDLLNIQEKYKIFHTYWERILYEIFSKFVTKK